MDSYNNQVNSSWVMVIDLLHCSPPDVKGQIVEPEKCAHHCHIHSITRNGAQLSRHVD